MKRVAVCLKGAVSKKGGIQDRFYGEGDLYREGEYIDYVAVRNSVYKHIVEPNSGYEFDFFLHGWNVDLADHLCNLYSPKSLVFEDNNNYNKIISSVVPAPQDFGGVSGALSLKKSLELKEMYEIKNQFTYDIVIVYRYDVLIWKDMLLDQYDVDRFLYVNSWNGTCEADFHFVMSTYNAHRFKYLFDSVLLYNNRHEFHKWIKNYVVGILGMQMKEDEILVGIDQEHMRSIGNIPALKIIADKYNEANIA